MNLDPSIQLTGEQAIQIAESGIWRDWTDEQVVRFQLFQQFLAMDFSRFQKAMEAVLGRPVYTHEFIGDDLTLEYLGEKQPPTMEEIIAMIPPEKRIILKSQRPKA